MGHPLVPCINRFRIMILHCQALYGTDLDAVPARDALKAPQVIFPGIFHHGNRASRAPSSALSAENAFFYVVEYFPARYGAVFSALLRIHESRRFSEETFRDGFSECEKDGSCHISAPYSLCMGLL